METNIENPWNVENLNEFLYFCCPECNLKDRSKMNFFKHALDEHPKAKECVEQFNHFIMKEEPSEEDIEENDNYDMENFDDSYYASEEHSEMLKCEIKEEPSEFSDTNSQVEHKKFPCNLCTKEFRSKGSLTTHIQAVHEGVKYPCQFCNKEFNYKYKIKRHNCQRNLIKSDPENEDVLNGQDDTNVDISSNSNKSFQCDFCEKKYKQKYVLQRHMQQAHEHEKMMLDQKYKCDTCEETFKHLKFLEEHAVEKHNIKIHKCEHCNKEFSKKSQLTAHTKIVHDKATSFMCDLCGKSFVQKSSLKKHHDHFHEKIKNHVCNICSKAFAGSTDLKFHIKCVHEGVRDKVCDLCGQGFAKANGLKNHIKNIHEGIKDHICQTCGKGFSDKHTLNYHVKTAHEGWRPHKCMFCDRSFPKKSKLKLHIKSAHRNLNYDLDLL